MNGYKVHITITHHCLLCSDPGYYTIWPISCINITLSLKKCNFILLCISLSYGLNDNKVHFSASGFFLLRHENRIIHLNIRHHQIAIIGFYFLLLAFTSPCLGCLGSTISRHHLSRLFLSHEVFNHDTDFFLPVVNIILIYLTDNQILDQLL